MQDNIIRDFSESPSPTTLKSIMKQKSVCGSPRGNKSPLRFLEPTKPFEITMNELNISEKSGEEIMTAHSKKRAPSRQMSMGFVLQK